MVLVMQQQQVVAGQAGAGSAVLLQLPAGSALCRAGFSPGRHPAQHTPSRHRQPHQRRHSDAVLPHQPQPVLRAELRGGAAAGARLAPPVPGRKQ